MNPTFSFKFSIHFFTRLFNFTNLQWWFKKWYRLSRIKIIIPVFTSRAPVNQVAWGTAFGVFWGLTPTVGLQIFILFLQWLLFRYLLRINFDFKIGVILVWISNPITILPMYYIFWKTGNLLLGIFTQTRQVVQNYAEFSQQISIFEDTNLSTIENIRQTLYYLLIELGQPMIIGCLVYALPSAVLGFIYVRHFLTKKRKKLALKAGLSYEKWCSLHERSYNF